MFGLAGGRYASGSCQCKVLGEQSRRVKWRHVGFSYEMVLGVADLVVSSSRSTYTVETKVASYRGGKIFRFVGPRTELARGVEIGRL
jgi:hypothetical protein